MRVSALANREMQVSMLIANETSFPMNHLDTIVLSATHIFSLPTPNMNLLTTANRNDPEATETENSIWPATKMRVKPSINIRTPALSTRYPRNTEMIMLEKL